MLRIVLIAVVFMSSSTAYALNNSDLIQLSQRISRQQQEQQLDVEQMLEPAEQARLRQQKYEEEQIGRRQQEQVKQEHLLQEVLWERQRREDARRLEEERQRDLLLRREQSGLF